MNVTTLTRDSLSLVKPENIIFFIVVAVIIVFILYVIYEYVILMRNKDVFEEEELKDLKKQK